MKVKSNGFEGGKKRSKDSSMALFRSTCLTMLFINSSVFVVGALKSHETNAQPTELTEIIVEGKKYKTTAGQVMGYRALTGFSATKTSTPVEQIPQTINIISRSVIDDQKNNTIDDILRNAPGITTVSTLAAPVADSTLIRGFFGDTWIDGLTSAFNLGDRQGSINVERIEVLKGPTGMLYGGSGAGSPIGGAINLISKLPESEAFGKVGVAFGSHASKNTFFDINQPVSDNILFRITGEYVEEESYIDVLERERYNINPTAIITNNSGTSLTIQGRYSSWKGQDYQGLPATGTLVGKKIDQDLFLGPDNIPDTTSKYKSLTLTLDHQLNDIWSMNIKGRHAEAEYDEKAQMVINAYFGGAVPNPPSVFFPFPNWNLTDIQVSQDNIEKTLTGSLLAEFDYGRTNNKFLMGADYSKLEDDSFFDFSFVGGGFTVVDLTDPALSFPSYVKPGAGIPNASLELETKGVSTQLQTSIDGKYHFVVGVRRAEIKIDYFALPGSTFPGDNSLSETKWLPRLGAVIDVTSTISIFAGYSEGMRGVAFNNTVGGLKPELSDQMEAGVKFNFADSLSGTLAVYEIERENVLVRVPTTLGAAAEGEQQSKGFEADIIYQPGKCWQILASYSYIDAEFTDNGPLSTVKKGNELAGVPEQSGRLWANYSFAEGKYNGLSIGAGVYIQEGSYLEATNDFKTDDFITVDAKIAYEAEQFEVSLAVQNLTGEDYYVRVPYHTNGRVQPSDNAAIYGSISWNY